MLGLGDAVYYQRVPETSYDRGTIDPRIVDLISVKSRGYMHERLHGYKQHTCPGRGNR
jgi:hypothetical protein